MKKNYLLVLLLIAILSSKAQFVITSAMNPIIGDVAKTWECDSITPAGYYPIGGTNQAWNFTGVAVNTTITPTSFTFGPVSSAPNAGSFPSANICSTSDNINYTFSSYSSSSVINYGRSTSTLSIVYSDPELINTLPFGYGNLSTDTYSATYNSSGPITKTATIVTTGDATGTLNLPGITYTNTLRLKHDIKEIDAASTYTLNYNTTLYTYLNATSKWVLFSVQIGTLVITTGTSSSTQFVKFVRIADAALITNTEESSEETSFNIFPNPVSNGQVNLTFASTHGENYQVRVVDAIGQEVKMISYNLGAGAQKETIDLSGLNAGLYFVGIKGHHKKEILRKLVIE